MTRADMIIKIGIHHRINEGRPETWQVSDTSSMSDDVFDDAEHDTQREAEDDAEERVDHYRKQGHRVEVVRT